MFPILLHVGANPQLRITCCNIVGSDKYSAALTQIDRSERLYWRLVVPGGIIFALIAQLLSTHCGLGLTSDSYLYIEGAEYFKGSLEGSMTDQPVFQAKPPLFSLFLSALPMLVLPFVYSILLVINLLILARVVFVVLSSGTWRTLAFIAVASFTPLVMVHVYLWTEPLFLVFLYFAVFILVTSTGSSLKKSSTIILAFVAILMVLTRHVGLFFVFGIFIAMSLDRSLGWINGLIVLIAGLGMFLIWNFAIMSDGMADRVHTLSAPIAAGKFARFQNIEYYLGAASSWLLPNAINKWVRILFFLVVSVGFFLMVRSKGSKPGVVKIFLIISLTYYILMHISFLIVESSADRYLMPIYPLVAITVFSIFESLSIKVKWPIIIVLVWLIYPVSRTIKNSLFWKEKICADNKDAISEILMDNYHTEKVR